MKLLDFASMKKIKADEKTSTFKHADGHEIKILHKMLPRIHQEQIKRIPIHDEEPVKLDEGTPDGTVADAAQAQGVQSPDAPPSPVAPTVVINNHPPVPADSSPQVQATTEQQASDQTPAPTVPQPAPAAAVPVHDMNRDIVAANKQNIQANQGAVNEVQSVLPKLQESIDDMIKSGVVNPNHYAESQSSDQKTGTAIGLALMGFGGTGKAGLDFINQQIDRDVAAQQKNYENKKTIYSAYNEMFGDSDIAANLAIAAGANIQKLKVQNAALQNGSSQAMKNLPTITAGLDQKANAALSNAAQAIVDKQNGSAEKPDVMGVYTPKPILRPDAAKQLQNLRVVNPLNTDVNEAQRQYSTAFLADKVLQNLPAQFRKLRENATYGGWVGRTPEVGSSLGAAGAAAGTATGGGIGGAIGSLGSGLKGLAGSALTGINALVNPNDGTAKENFARDRDYESAKTQLTNDILAALHGTNVGGEAVANIVNANTPDYQDTPENVTTKLRTIENFIRMNATGSLLGTVNMDNQ